MNAAAEAGEARAGRTLVCFAMKEEAQCLPPAFATPSRNVLITGIGAKNSAHAVQPVLEQFRPERVFTCGFAGGLKPALQIGEVVFFTRVKPLADSLIAAGARPANFFGADRIAITAVEKAELWQRTGADAVEMESETIQRLCLDRGIPCATVRAISDAAQDDLPLDFNRLANPDLSLNYRRLALAVAKSPGKIPALLRLQKHSRLAAQRLAAVLLAVGR